MRRSTPAPALLLAAALVLAGCGTGGEPADPATDPEPTPTATETETPEQTPTESPLPPEVDSLAFPDPASVIDASFRDGQDADGQRVPVIDGTPLELASLGGSCFDGGIDDVCAFALHTIVEPWTGAEPEPFAAALLLLLESAGMADDGTPEWTIRDALVARNPGDEPGYLQACEGMEAVVAYSPPTATGPTLPVTAAWGVDDGATRLVELEPDAVTCEYVGD